MTPADADDLIAIILAVVANLSALVLLVLLALGKDKNK